DEREVPRLRAVAVDGDPLARENRAAEAMERHVRALSRAVHREVAERRDRQAEVPAVEERQVLARELRDAVGRVGARQRGLARRVALGVAVDARRRGEDEAFEPRALVAL